MASHARDEGRGAFRVSWRTGTARGDRGAGLAPATGDGAQDRVPGRRKERGPCVRHEPARSEHGGRLAWPASPVPVSHGTNP